MQATPPLQAVPFSAGGSAFVFWVSCTFSYTMEVWQSCQTQTEEGASWAHIPDLPTTVLQMMFINQEAATNSSWLCCVYSVSSGDTVQCAYTITASHWSKRHPERVSRTEIQMCSHFNLCSWGGLLPDT